MIIASDYFLDSLSSIHHLNLKFVFVDILQFFSFKGDLAIRRIFSLVDMITKPKFSNCPNVFKICLLR